MKNKDSKYMGDEKYKKKKRKKQAYKRALNRNLMPDNMDY